MLREETMLCFGTVTEPSRFSTSMQSTPRSPSSQASASPTGPPPTMSTDVVVLLILSFRRPILLSSPRRRGPLRRVVAVWHHLAWLETLVVMGPRLRGDDSREIVLREGASLHCRFCSRARNCLPFHLTRSFIAGRD